MTDWELVEPASVDKPGKVRSVKTYSLMPGMAYAYHERPVTLTTTRDRKRA
jgi:hypothetical protein